MRRLLYAIIVLTMMVSTLSLAQGGGQGGGGGPGGGGSGSGTISGQTTGCVPLATSATGSTSSSSLCDNGTTVSTTENISTPGIVAAGAMAPTKITGPTTPDATDSACSSGVYWLKAVAGSVNHWRYCDDGTLGTMSSSSGGGTPGGSDTQVQFNDGGSAFNGDSGLTYNKTTKILSIAGGTQYTGNGGTRLHSTAVLIAQLPGNGSCVTSGAGNFASCTPVPGDQFVVSNSNSTNGCDATVGGGTTQAWVYYTGSVYAPINPVCYTPFTYVDATSSIQTQLNGKQASGTYMTGGASPLGTSGTTVTCPTATSSVPGCLAAADWTTFNGKQNALTNPVVTIFSGSQALGTTLIASGAWATTITVTATGVQTTDTVDVTWASSPRSVTGYAGTTSGALTIYVSPAADSIVIDIYNGTSASIMPSAMTLNLKVRR